MNDPRFNAVEQQATIDLNSQSDITPQEVAPEEQPALPSPAPRPAASSWKPVLRELVETIVLTLVIFLLIRTVVQNFRVDGLSMEPSFHDGQFLLVNKLAYRLGEPQRGDVIVFHYPRDPTRDFIKRVIGLPGETVEIIEGKVYINGDPLPGFPSVRPASYDTRPTILADDELYVLGDNRPSSSDSHRWGALPLDMVIGRVLLSYWPPQYWGLVAGDATADSPNPSAGSEEP